MRRLRWKKQPAQTGLAAVGAAPRGSKYHDGENDYATVSPLGGGWRPMEDWYFVARYDPFVPLYNSCSEPCVTESEAKQQAQEYVKMHLALKGD